MRQMPYEQRCLKNVKIGTFLLILKLKTEQNQLNFCYIDFFILRKINPYGDGTANERTYKKWFVKSHRGDFSLAEVLRPSR